MALTLKMSSRPLFLKLALAMLMVAMISGLNALSASELKQRIKVRDATVKLSDIFTDVGLEQDREVFNAPMPGSSVNISTLSLWKIAKANDIKWEKPRLNKHIRIMREGQPVDVSALKERLAEEVKMLGVDGDIEVTLFGMNRNMYLPVNSDMIEIELDSLTLNAGKSRYRAELLWPLGNGSYKEVSLNGAIEHVRLVPALNRVLVPGEVIAKSDIKWINIPVKRIVSNSIQSTDNIVGFTPRRALSANKLLRNADLEAIKYVRKGNQVTLSYISGPMVLSTFGKALQHGAMGDSIRILNTTTNKIIYANVVGPGQVEIRRPSHNNTRKLASR